MARHKHGMWGTRTYQTWLRMVRRCTVPYDKDYPAYGGKGITVCQRWLSFHNFLEDMGIRPPGMTLDRIKNRKGYSKKNCRWATPKQQANNRSSNVILSFRDKQYTVVELASVLGMPVTTLRNRLYRGWPLEKAATPHCSRP